MALAIRRGAFRRGLILRQKELSQILLVVVHDLGRYQLALAVTVGLTVIVIVRRVGIAGFAGILLAHEPRKVAEAALVRFAVMGTFMFLPGMAGIAPVGVEQIIETTMRFGVGSADGLQGHAKLFRPPDIERPHAAKRKFGFRHTDGNPVLSQMAGEVSHALGRRGACRKTGYPRHHALPRDARQALRHLGGNAGTVGLGLQ